MLVVADTSALVSLGTVADRDPNPLDYLLDTQKVTVPTRVIAELEETAAYDDPSGAAAATVLDHRNDYEVRECELDETFPLDDGENATVTLANDLDATQLLCDEFTQLALVHASLADTRLVTTPTLLVALIRNDVLSAAIAEDILAEMSDGRSWSSNAYAQRARATLHQQ